VFLRPALIAVQFLTCFPIRLKQAPVGREVGLSLLWYPAVGLLLGLVLWAGALLFSPLAPPLAAALVLTVWIFATGALHLDGLADTADAWVGGRADRERTLAVMKDPHSGPTAVAAVVCTMLIKFSALSELRGAAGPLVWSDLHFACGCILPPLLARAGAPLLLAHTLYVRPEGIAVDLAQYQSRLGAWLVAALTGLSVTVACGRHGLAAVASTAMIHLVMRLAFIRRLGGVTGDCAGATIEISETASLVVLGA
jgi:adenosylcobinamide-GDP ribazoletransferase